MLGEGVNNQEGIGEIYGEKDSTRIESSPLSFRSPTNPYAIVILSGLDS